MGGLPLLAYPFVALASLMSLAGHRTEEESTALMMAATAAQVSSLLYPGVYCLAVFLVFTQFRGTLKELICSAIPLVYLLFVVALFGLWVAMG